MVKMVFLLVKYRIQATTVLLRFREQLKLVMVGFLKEETRPVLISLSLIQL